MLRQCIYCGVLATSLIELELFKKNNKQPHGRENSCKICSNKRNRGIKLKVSFSKRAPKSNTYKLSHEEIKLRKRAAVYNISVDALKALYKEQNYRCKICNISEIDLSHNNSHRSKLFIDHCHTTGKVRGLLCPDCNSMVGYSKDNPEVLQAGAKYLKDMS